MESGRDNFALRRLCEKRRLLLNKNETEEDRISCLPEHIVHLILDRLPLKDAARTSILSKTWKWFSSFYPIEYLHFDQNSFAKPFLLEPDPNKNQIRERFIDFVDASLSKAKQQKTLVRKLALTVTVNDSECFPRIDHLMELVMKLKRVEKLCLFIIQTHENNEEIEEDDDDVFYSVPFSVFTLNGLRSLQVRACSFANVVGSGAYSSLQQLSLLHGVFDEQFAMNLTRFCPGIEVLELNDCNIYVESLALSMFPRLKKASFVETWGSLNKLIIDNSSLESLEYDCGEAKFELIPAACGSIRELILTESVPPNLCVDLFNTFPLLEEANLTFCHLAGHETLKVGAANRHLRKLFCSFPVESNQVKEIRIECPKLQYFTFVGHGLKEFHIDCPNLRRFCYFGKEFPVLVLSKATSVLKYIYFQLGPFSHFSVPWFIQLRGVIEELAEAGRAIHLHLRCSWLESVPTEFGAFEGLRHNNVHVELSIGHYLPSAEPASLVDGVIWSTCPTSLSIRDRDYIVNDIFKHMRDKMEKKPRYETCEELCNKCWWHHLKDFEIETVDGSKFPKTSCKLFWRSNDVSNAPLQ